MEFLPCPSCGVLIEILEVNCAIFRCGVVKATGEQINPHLPKAECDALGDTIWGCAKPMRLVDGKLIICDYI